MSVKDSEDEIIVEPQKEYFTKFESSVNDECKAIIETAQEYIISHGDTEDSDPIQRLQQESQPLEIKPLQIQSTGETKGY